LADDGSTIIRKCPPPLFHRGAIPELDIQTLYSINIIEIALVIEIAKIIPSHLNKLIEVPLVRIGQCPGHLVPFLELGRSLSGFCHDPTIGPLGAKIKGLCDGLKTGYRGVDKLLPHILHGEFMKSGEFFTE
jgi:hypothetical protein